MTELRHVWVCGKGLVVLRADHIVGLSIVTPNGGPVDPDKVLGATDVQLRASTASAGGLPLAQGSGDAVESLMSTLPPLLASVAESTAAHLYVHHVEDSRGVRVWETSARLPEDWSQRAEHSDFG